MYTSTEAKGSRVDVAVRCEWILYTSLDFVVAKAVSLTNVRSVFVNETIYVVPRASRPGYIYKFSRKSNWS